MPDPKRCGSVRLLETARIRCPLRLALPADAVRTGAGPERHHRIAGRAQTDSAAWPGRAPGDRRAAVVALGDA